MGNPDPVAPIVQRSITQEEHPMTKASRQTALWAGVILGALLLFGCSSDSTTAPAASEPAPFPFGLQSATTTSDWDGDDSWDDRTTTSFSYNASGRAVALSVTDEWDDNADGLPDFQTVITTTYDPNLVDVTPRFVEMLVAKRPSSPDGLGTVLSETYEEFFSDGAGSLFLQRRETYTFSYDGQGRRLREERLSEVDNDGNGVIDLIYNSISSTRFDAAGNLLSESRIDKEDLDGDGVFDSVNTNESTWTFTAGGAPLTYLHVQSLDADGDGPGADITQYDSSESYVYDSQRSLLSYYRESNSHDGTTGAVTATSTYDEDYANTYANSLLAEAVVSVDEGGVLSSYAVTCLYDPAGNLAEKKSTYDQSGTAGVPDAWYTETWTYDTTGRLTARGDRSDIDTDEDGILDHWSQSTETWSYDAAGLLSGYTYGSQAGEDNTSVIYGHDLSEKFYAFENGLLTGSGDSYQYDNDGDGLFDVRYASTSTYTYEGGVLTERRQDYVDDNTLDTPGDEYLYSSGGTYTYQNGDLTGVDSWEGQDSDGTPLGTYHTTISYDAAGRVTGMVTEGDGDGDEVIDFTETRVLTNDVTARSVAVETSTIDSPAVPLLVEAADAYLLTFGENGIPTGTMDAPWDGVRLNYPEDREDYQITIKVPKILGLLDALNFNSRK
jgi:hypothetical protein